MEYILKTLPTWITLAGFLAATATAGAMGAVFKPGQWYRTLRKPGWTPPDWAFPLAWTLLYIAMGVAAWWVALSPSPLALPGLALWAWQIVVNAVWSPVVFGGRRLGAGVVVILVLWIAVALTTRTFWQVSALSGWLMAPYLAWVSYAAALNVAICWMNPGAET
jgi:tryptophan-rich sensory protein